MKRSKTLLGALLAFLWWGMSGCMGEASAETPSVTGGSWGLVEPTTGAFMGTVVGTCTDGSVMVDINGLVRCGADTTTDPSDVIVRSGACYELDATCTAPDLLLAGGIDTKQYTGVTQANCGTDTITVTVVDNGGTSTANALVEGTDWDCLTDDNTCATALAAAIDALTGVSAQASANTVGVRPGDTTIKLTLASSDATCATAANGTDGVVGVAKSVKLLLNTDDTGGGESYIIDNGAPGSPTVRLYAGSNAVTYSGTTMTIGSGPASGSIKVLGDVDLANNEFIANTTDGKITLGGAGGTNNEDIIFDFETSADRLEITSSTGVTLWDFNSTSIIPSQVYSNLYNSTSGVTSAGINFDSTQADIVFTSSASYGNQWIFGPGASYAKDFDHAPQTNPTVYVHSDTDPDTDNTQWLSLSHDVTQGRIETGTGKIAFGGVGGTNNEDLTLDFESTANRVILNSTTGITRFDIGGTIEMFAYSYGTTTSFNAGSAFGFNWSSRSRLSSPADGQVTIKNTAQSSGATLDIDDAADTVVIKDVAGTAAGNLGLLDSGKLLFDADTDSDTYLSASGDTLTVTNNAGLTVAFTTAGPLLYDSKSLRMGSGADQTLTYTDGTGVQWNDGTNNVITVPDDSGQVNIAGDLTVTGDQTYYGSMYIASNQTIAMDASPTPKQVGTFTAGADLNGTSFATNELTITNAGKYVIMASVSSQLDTPGGDKDVVKAYVYLDDGTPAAITGCTVSRTYDGGGDVGATSISCIANIAASDKIELWMENTEDGTDVIVNYANVSVHKL